MLFRKTSFIILLFVATSLPVISQTVEQKIPDKTRLLFLMDGSASMFGEWERTLKIRAAKAILTQLVDSLKVNQDLELGLRVYGHQFRVQERNCKDSELIVPFSKDNHDQIISAIRDIEPKGTTPIAYSLIQAANDFPVSNNFRNIVIIITDGIESCDGDPCEVSLNLQRQGVFLRPFIIGMNLENIRASEFECIGDYHDARKISDFRDVLNDALNQSLGETSVTIELLDDKGGKTETDVNVTFINSFTREPVYEFVHYRDDLGRTDTIEVDPVLDYNIRVNTIPPVYKNQVRLKGGEHNEIRIKTPQGNLRFEMRNSSTYKKGVKVIVKEPEKENVIHIQDINENIKYLAGQYNIEVTTLPKTIFRDVEIERGKTKTLRIEEPGLINLSSTAPLYGSIYQMKGNREIWVVNMDTDSNVTTITLQPGDYKVAFRTKETFGSKYTAIRNFTIRPGKSTSINLNYKN